MKCKDCDLEFINDHDEEHPGLCCNCYDISLGMPPEFAIERLSGAERKSILDRLLE